MDSGRKKLSFVVTPDIESWTGKRKNGSMTVHGLI